MINLKTEEFVLDMNTLQALQQLLQWVGDFVLYLLASLPNQVRPPAASRPPTPGAATPPPAGRCPPLPAAHLPQSQATKAAECISHLRFKSTAAVAMVPTSPPSPTLSLHTH